MPDSNRPSPKFRQLTIPTRLYSRGNFYYFRVVLPDSVEPQPEHGRLEIRLSLRTAFRQTAKKLAHKLYYYLRALLDEVPMMDYLEIKRRMNQYLQKMLEDDHNFPSKRSRHRVGPIP